jgi:MgtC family
VGSSTHDCRRHSKGQGHMGSFWPQLGVDLGDVLGLVRVAGKLLLAALLGAVMGWERELAGKAAGVRTHTLVALGAAMFVLVSLEAGVGAGDLTRVIQGWRRASASSGREPSSR